MKPRDVDAILQTAEFMLTPFKRKLAVLVLILGCTVGCDQVSKQLVREKLEHIERYRLPMGLGELRLAENAGSFLSLGASLPGAMRQWILIIGVGAGLAATLIYLIVNTRSGWMMYIGVALAWAGGTSNLIDRVSRNGYVTDFIFLQVGPFHTGVFNIADTVILIGVLLITSALWKQKPPKSRLSP